MSKNAWIIVGIILIMLAIVAGAILGTQAALKGGKTTMNAETKNQSLAAPPDPYLLEDIELNIYVRKRGYEVMGVVPLFAEKNKNSNKVGEVKTGDKVECIQVDYLSHPIKCLITQDHVGQVSKRQFVRGDHIWVLAYLEDGYFKVWYKGEVFTEYMLGILGLHNQTEGVVWGRKIETSAGHELWMKFKTPSGVTGWASPKIDEKGYIY